MDPRRSERLSEALREELEELVSYELSDPRIHITGIAEVLISPDARTARVRVITGGDAQSQRETLEALGRARGFIRRVLTHRVDVFRLPELHFEAAMPAEMTGRVPQLLKRIRRGRPRTQDSTTNQ